MLYVRLQRCPSLFQVQDVRHVAAQGTPGRSKPNRMKVCLDKFFVAQLQPCGSNCSGDHQARLPKEVLVVLTTLATERHHQGRLSATTSTSAALRIVRWRW